MTSQARPRKGQPDIGALLHEGHFGASAGALPASDPVAPTPMVVEIDRIQPYDRNPRRVPNAEYERIKDSIRSTGAGAVLLEITRRPGADHYMIAAGGNTRLSIVKALYAETGEDRFRHVVCLFQPWTSDIEVLSAHLRENDLRGEMCFIDRAAAVEEIRRELNQREGRELNRSELARALSALGYPTNRRDLIRYEYAVEILEPVIPEAIKRLGPRAIDEIRHIDQGYRAFYEQLPAHNGAPFDQLWGEALAAHDAPELPLSKIREDLDWRLSEISGIPAHRLRLQVDAGRHEAGYSDGASDNRPAESGPHPVTPASSSPLAPPQPLTAAPVDSAVPPDLGRVDPSTSLPRAAAHDRPSDQPQFPLIEEEDEAPGPVDESDPPEVGRSVTDPPAPQQQTPPGSQRNERGRLLVTLGKFASRHGSRDAYKPMVGAESAGRLKIGVAANHGSSRRLQALNAIVELLDRPDPPYDDHWLTPLYAFIYGDDDDPAADADLEALFELLRYAATSARR